MRHLARQFLQRKLRILPLEVILDRQRHAGTHQTSTTHDGARSVVTWFLGVRKHVAGIEVGDSGRHEVDDSERSSALGSWAREGRAEPGDAQVVG